MSRLRRRRNMASNVSLLGYNRETKKDASNMARLSLWGRMSTCMLPQLAWHGFKRPMGPGGRQRSLRPALAHRALEAGHVISLALVVRGSGAYCQPPFRRQLTLALLDELCPLRGSAPESPLPFWIFASRALTELGSLAFIGAPLASVGLGARSGDALGDKALAVTATHSPSTQQGAAGGALTLRAVIAASTNACCFARAAVRPAWPSSERRPSASPRPK
mmetsp:Transcript_42391/g.99298  ORF Transcript_42391/g.99298 Transcript_42391/m.99298 type:complete len:220 (-) Transcript_42391:171-830(-)